MAQVCSNFCPIVFEDLSAARAVGKRARPGPGELPPLSSPLGPPSPPFRYSGHDEALDIHLGVTFFQDSLTLDEDGRFNGRGDHLRLLPRPHRGSPRESLSVPEAIGRQRKDVFGARKMGELVVFGECLTVEARAREVKRMVRRQRRQKTMEVCCYFLHAFYARNADCAFVMQTRP